MKKIILITLLLSRNLAYGGDTIKISNDLALIQVTQNTYIHTSCVNDEKWGKVWGNGMIHVNKKEAIIVNTPWTDEQTKLLCDYLQGKLKLKINCVIMTHFHADCMGGLSEINKRGIENYSLEKTKELAILNKLPMPKNTFKDSLTLLLNKEPITLFYPGAAHTKDNIVVWLPKEKVLFAGCLAKEINSKTLGNTTDAEVNSWTGTIEKIQRRFRNASIVIPGHGKPGGQELLSHTITLLK